MAHFAFQKKDLIGFLFHQFGFPSIEADLPAILVEAHDAVDLMRAEQMAMLGVAKAAFWATKLPDSLCFHSFKLPRNRRSLRVTSTGYLATGCGLWPEQDDESKILKDALELSRTKSDVQPARVGVAVIRSTIAVVDWIEWSLAKRSSR